MSDNLEDWELEQRRAEDAADHKLKIQQEDEVLQPFIDTEAPWNENKRN